MADKLTPKQSTFVAEYLVDLNATQAAIRAGYSEKTANEQGSRLLANVKITDAIADAMANRAERTEITQDRVLRELARLGFSDLRKTMTQGGALLDPQDWDDDTAASIAAILPNPRKYKASPRTKYIDNRKNWIVIQMRNYGTFDLTKAVSK